MNITQAKTPKLSPHYFSNIVSPIKLNPTYSIQLQEPFNDTIKLIKSSIGFSAMNNEDYYSNQKQFEIANDKDQNNEEIIVNNQVHEKVIDQHSNTKGHFNNLCPSNNVNHLDFITTLLKLQRPKSGKGIARNEDESKFDIKDIIDLCEEPNTKRITTNDVGYTSNITGNCNLDSFLNDITPRKKGFEPKMHSDGKKGLSTKDLIEITNKRKHKLNVGSNNNKGNYTPIGNKDNERKGINSINGMKANQNEIIKKRNEQSGNKTNRHNSTGSIRYIEEVNNNNCNDYNYNNDNNNYKSDIIEDQSFPIIEREDNERNRNTDNYYQLNQNVLNISSEENILTKVNPIVKETQEKGINTSNTYFINQASELAFNPSNIVMQKNTSSESSYQQPLNILSNRYMSNKSTTTEIEKTKISSNQINKSDLCNTIPQVQQIQYQPREVNRSNANIIVNAKSTHTEPTHTHLPIQQYNPPIPHLPQKPYPYSYGSFNFEINNKIYLPNGNSYTKGNNTNDSYKNGTSTNKNIISIKPSERSSFNDFVNYGSNPLANKPTVKQMRPNNEEVNNESLSLIIPLNPTNQSHNEDDDDFKIQMANCDYKGVDDGKVEKFSIDQPSYHYNKEQINNYKTNMSVGSSANGEGGDNDDCVSEPSQVYEYDIVKNKKQNESKEMKFSSNQIHSSNTNANISSVNLSKLTNFVDCQSKKNFSTTSTANVIASNQPLNDKKDYDVAEIDLYADDDNDINANENNNKTYNAQEEKGKIIMNHISKEQPSPYTQQLKKKINYFDEASLYSKDNGYSNMKHSIVESIKEKQIEYDIDDMLNPSYLYKNFQLANKSEIKRHLSKSFCGLQSNTPSVSNVNATANANSGIKASISKNTNVQQSSKRNLSKSNSFITNINMTHIENNNEISKSSHNTSFIPTCNHNANKVRSKVKNSNNNKQKKYIQKVNTGKINNKNKAKSSITSKESHNIKTKPSYKFEPKKKQQDICNDKTEEIKQVKDIQKDLQLQIVPSVKLEIAKRIDTMQSECPHLSALQLASLIKDKTNVETKYDLNLDAFSIEVQNTNVSKKNEYTPYVNDLVLDSFKMQRLTQEKARKKIIQNLNQIVLSQQENEKEIKDKMTTMELTESQMGESATSFAAKLECERQLNQFLK